jgi:hypothetical protein
LPCTLGDASNIGNLMLRESRHDGAPPVKTTAAKVLSKREYNLQPAPGAKRSRSIGHGQIDIERSDRA